MYNFFIAIVLALICIGLETQITINDAHIKTLQKTIHQEGAICQPQDHELYVL
jgi:hypothetical protein